MDQLIDEGRRELDQNKRRQIYAGVQRIVQQDLPYINLWYFDNVLVTSDRVRNVQLSSSGNYDFLITAELTR
jgi:peptide/nickel transport system substrate-binding protein